MRSGQVRCATACHSPCNNGSLRVLSLTVSKQQQGGNAGKLRACCMNQRLAPDRVAMPGLEAQSGSLDVIVSAGRRQWSGGFKLTYSK